MSENIYDTIRDGVLRGLEVDNPREEGRKAIRETVDPKIWDQNEKFCQKLMSILAKHPLATHPIKEFFDNETLNKEKTLKMHLEFGYAFAQIFTDAVVKAMYESKQMDKRVGPAAKVTARFLLNLNLMDELGYIPSANKTDYAGHPYGAHFYQYVKMFKDLDSPVDSINDYDPSEEAIIARKTFEDQYEDYALLTTVLALAESIFDGFAGPWAANVGKSSEIDVSKGYHTIHVEDEDGESIDDDHSEDSWTLVKQAITPDQYDLIEEKAKSWLDDWFKFSDKILDIAIS